MLETHLVPGHQPRSVGRTSSGRRLVGLRLVLFGCVLVGSLAAQPGSESAVVRARDAAELRETRVAGYSVTEQYAIRSSRFNVSAQMTVATIYRRDHGKTRTVISRSGSPTLQSRVFDRLLREEGDMSRGEVRRQTLVNSENYLMRLSGEEVRSSRKCYVVDLTPRRASTHLLKGRAWIDTEDGSLVRLDGRPGASPSFITGRPNIVREFAKVGEFWLAKSTHAISDSFLFGRTELHIDYVDYHTQVDP